MSMKNDLTGEPIRLVADDIPDAIPEGMSEDAPELAPELVDTHNWNDDEMSIIKAHIALHQMNSKERK